MYPLIFTEKFIPSWAAGCANGPLVFIRPKYKDDKGLIAHEVTHVKQWFCTLGFHSLFYLFLDLYKLWAEVQAYKKQATYYQDDRLPLFAGFISQNYGLSITPEAALELLRTA